MGLKLRKTWILILALLSPTYTVWFSYFTVLNLSSHICKNGDHDIYRFY